MVLSVAMRSERVDRHACRGREERAAHPRRGAPRLGGSVPLRFDYGELGRPPSLAAVAGLVRMSPTAGLKEVLPGFHAPGAPRARPADDSGGALENTLECLAVGGRWFPLTLWSNNDGRRLVVSKETLHRLNYAIGGGTYQARFTDTWNCGDTLNCSLVEACTFSTIA